MKTIHDRELEVANRIASAYRKKGYRVLVQPPQSELPAFLHGFELDLVAMSHTDNVVIEVKIGRQLPSNRRLPEIASAIADQKGWRLELVSRKRALGARPEVDATASLPPFISPSEATERLESARGLMSKDQMAGLLLVWTVVEPALDALTRNRSGEATRVSVRSLIQAAYSYGLITWADYRLLRRSLEVRNHIAHGRTVSIDSRLVKDVWSIATILVRQWSTT